MEIDELYDEINTLKEDLQSVKDDLAIANDDLATEKALSRELQRDVDGLRDELHELNEDYEESQSNVDYYVRELERYKKVILGYRMHSKTRIFLNDGEPDIDI